MPFRTIEFDGVTFDHLIHEIKDPNNYVETYRHVILSGKDGETVIVSRYVSGYGDDSSWAPWVLFHEGERDERFVLLSHVAPHITEKGADTKANVLKVAIAYIKERRAELAEKKRGVA